MAFGVMGGDMQPQGQVQVLVNMIDFGLNVQEAGDAARWRHFGNATPTGLPAEGIGTVQLESGFDPGLAAELEKRGYKVDLVKPGTGAFGGYESDPVRREASGVLGRHRNAQGWRGDRLLTSGGDCPCASCVRRS